MIISYIFEKRMVVKRILVMISSSVKKQCKNGTGPLFGRHGFLALTLDQFFWNYEQEQEKRPKG
jgi:hypothetical protein